MKQQWEGVLPIHKPAGWTSHDAVAKVRRLLGIRRIGHTGTLDPAATGVLPLCLGRATRLVEYIQEQPKEYVAELTIGYATDTLDATGTVTERVERVELDEARIHAAVARFAGQIEQVPPMYSAVRHQGKRLYELAREGREVERKPRRVYIHRIEAEQVDVGAEFPVVRLRVLCSKGTYIRTLCADIGRALGYPAVMSALVRTAAGAITLDRCLSPEEAEERVRDGTIGRFIMRPEDAVAFMPKLTLPASLALRALQGQTLRLDRTGLPDELAGLAADAAPAPDADPHRLAVRVFDESGMFLGIFTCNASARTLRPDKVFAAGVIAK